MELTYYKKLNKDFSQALHIFRKDYNPLLVAFHNTFFCYRSQANFLIFSGIILLVSTFILVKDFNF